MSEPISPVELNDNELDYELEQDSSVDLYNKQCEVEEKMETLFHELKDYTNEMILPLCEKLNTENLIDLLYSDLRRVY